MTAVDKLDNTVLHYAASSDNDVLVKWVATLLREEEGEGGVDKVNKVGVVRWRVGRGIATCSIMKSQILYPYLVEVIHVRSFCKLKCILSIA